MQYQTDSWHGHENTHCPFCSFATTSPNATALVDGHVAAVHPRQLRQALAGEMTAEVHATRNAMNKAQLLELATSMGIDGLSERNKRDEITAAIDAAEANATTAAAPAASEDA